MSVFRKGSEREREKRWGRHTIKMCAAGNVKKYGAKLPNIFVL